MIVLNQDEIKKYLLKNWTELIDFRLIRSIISNEINLQSPLETVHQTINYNVNSNHISLIEINFIGEDLDLWFSFSKKLNKSEIIIGSIELRLNKIGEIISKNLVAQNFSLS